MLPLDRFPLITEPGHRLLQRLQEHPCAPRYTHLGYDRMTLGGLARATDFAALVQAEPPRWQPGEVPEWLRDFGTDCYRRVPFYRQAGPPPADFFDLPFTQRADLNREPWAFVPDDAPLDDLIVYNTSGTTGHPLDILTHPDTLALYLPLLRAALADYGVDLKAGPEGVAIVLVCAQQRTYTYAAVSAVLDQAGFVKVNLLPDGWRDPADRARFLDDCQPQVYTGDPLAFMELAKLPLKTRPAALVSTAMALLPGWRQTLETRFGCPVLDIYSLNESGPVAVAAPSGVGGPDGDGAAYRLLQPRLYVEIVDGVGRRRAPGERGEVVLSGGFNPLLPLLRYRTGDFARLIFQGGQPLLADFEGRPPVTFRSATGQWLNNIDVSLALRDFPLAQYTLHQSADGALQFRVRGAGVPLDTLRAALLALFGAEQALTVEAVDDLGPAKDKLVQYTSDVEQINGRP
jgi:phenylacetate-CoA ligase